MACNCREQITKMIREQLGDPLANIRGVICFGKDGVVQFKPTVAITYRKKKKMVAFVKHKVRWNFHTNIARFADINLKKIKK